MNHISLETARKLHQLGYSRETKFMWGRYFEWVFIDGEPTEEELYDQDYSIEYPDNLPDHVYFEAEFAAPLAEELLEVLPKIVTVSDKEYDLHIQTDSASFYPRYMCREGLTPFCASLYGTCHNSIAEALSLLLIELVEQGIVSKDSLTDKK